MNEVEELKLEEELIPKIWKRLDNIRAYKKVIFPITTYDTNAVLAEIGSEIRQARIVERKSSSNGSFLPTEKQIKWINDLRKQAGETSAYPKEFSSEQQIDSEIARLKNKSRILLEKKT
jgi:Fe-S cluster assembly scaffold protein SufB